MSIERPFYLNKLIASRNNGMIKIITGLRRSGKSYLLKTLYRDYLLNSGVPTDHILIFDFEDWRSRAYRNPDNLLAKIEALVADADQYYLIIDEVQQVEHFVEVLSTIGLMNNIDCYVTGSNSHLLSKDVITEFRGRGDEIHVLPLSFKEYFSYVGGNETDAWLNYLRYGGLPQVWSHQDEEWRKSYLQNLFKTTYYKDIYERYNIEHKSEFEELTKVVASSVGSLLNPLNLSNTFKSIKKVRNITDKTISTYLGYLQNAYLMEESVRYDIKGKKYIGNLAKYYFQDVGLRNAVLRFRQVENTHLMENIIYNELRAKDFRVDIGNVGVVERNPDGVQQRKILEVDFVAEKNDRKIYIQSAWRLPDKEKIEQELRSLNLIPDNFEKIVVVGEKMKMSRNEQGIVFMDIFDFLLTDYI